MIDLNEIEVAARKPWYCRSKQEDNLLRPEILVELITRLREAEKDAARWRRMYDSALREAKQQYEWRMEDSECGGNEVREGLYMLECRVIDQAMKEKGDE
jgi:hypothetical protein